jgi:hypothetical protein
MNVEPALIQVDMAGDDPAPSKGMLEMPSNELPKQHRQ